jgi:hypothetical protein
VSSAGSLPVDTATRESSFSRWSGSAIRALRNLRGLGARAAGFSASVRMPSGAGQRACSSGPPACSSGVRFGDFSPVLVSEDRHNPLPHIALSTTALKSAYRNTTSLSTHTATELRELLIPGGRE